MDAYAIVPKLVAQNLHPFRSPFLGPIAPRTLPLRPAPRIPNTISSCQVLGVQSLPHFEQADAVDLPSFHD